MILKDLILVFNHVSQKIWVGYIPEHQGYTPESV
jgi:hypothetical protein